MAESGSNGMKTSLTVVIGLFAIIAGVYSMMEPMGLRVSSLSDDLKDIRAAMAEDDIREREDKGDLAAMQEKFKEVGAQFKGLRELIDVRLFQLEKDRDKGQAWQADHDPRVRGLNAAQWERIKALEREVYGKSVGIMTGEAEGAASDD